MSSIRNSTQALNRNEAKKNAAANRGTLAGSRRPRAVNDIGVGCVTKRRRTQYFYDDSVGVFLSTNILDGWPESEPPSPAPQGSIPDSSPSWLIKPTSDTDGNDGTDDTDDTDDSDDNDHEPQQEEPLPVLQPAGHEPQQQVWKPLLTLQPTSVLTLGHEDLHGRILWCPGQAWQSAIPPDSNLRAAHPVLIIQSQKIEEEDNRVYVSVLLLTSFGNMTLSERFPSMSAEAVRLRSYFLPIEGTPQHPDDPVRNFMVMTTKRPHNPRRASYINFLMVRTVPFDLLQAYKDGPAGFSQDYRVELESYKELGKFFETQPRPTGLEGWERRFRRPGGLGRLRGG